MKLWAVLLVVGCVGATSLDDIHTFTATAGVLTPYNASGPRPQLVCTAREELCDNNPVHAVTCGSPRLDHRDRHWRRECTATSKAGHNVHVRGSLICLRENTSYVPLTDAARRARPIILDSCTIHYRPASILTEAETAYMICAAIVVLIAACACTVVIDALTGWDTNFIIRFVCMLGCILALSSSGGSAQDMKNSDGFVTGDDLPWKQRETV